MSVEGESLIYVPVLILPVPIVHVIFYYLSAAVYFRRCVFFLFFSLPIFPNTAKE